MDKTECRSVMKFFDLEEIFKKMMNILTESTSLLATVLRWVSEFERDRPIVDDEPIGGRPETATTQGITEQVHNIVGEHPSSTKREFADTICINRVQTVAF